MSTETIAPVVNGVSLAKSGLLEFERPLLRIQQDIEGLEKEQRESGRDHSAEIREQKNRLTSMTKKLYASLTPWEAVMVARHPRRPQSTDYLKLIFRDFCELHGDRTFGDDRAILTGFARVGSHKVMFIGHNKGKDVKERVACHFGCAHPEGYRKALSKMKLAEKYGVPVVCLIDTQGAYPGLGSEERGIGYAIAVNLMEMSRLRTPVVCVVIGEGGSGGALGIGVGDRVAMMQHAFYSVISPEGCAAILWKTAEQRQLAAEALKITAPELLKLGVIDDVVAEPVGGAHRNPEAAAESLERYITTSLDGLKGESSDTLLRQRYARIRDLGSFFESPGEKLRRAHAAATHARRASGRTSRLEARLAAAEHVVNP